MIECGVFTLLRGSQCHARSRFTAFENGPFAHDDLQFRIRSDQLVRSRDRLTTIGAAVIGELDQDVRAFGIAEHRAREGLLDPVRRPSKAIFRLFALVRLGHVRQDLRVRQQIAACLIVTQAR